MIVNISLAIAALLFSAVLGASTGGYTNAPITYFRTLDCTSCIRGGYNYCLIIGGKGNGTLSSWECDDRDRIPNAFINNTDPDGVAGGWLCSHAMADQMNSIINGCRPWANQNLNDDCGSYFIDLSGKSDYSIGRSVQDLPVNSSCTYRAISTCGYPQASWRVNDPKIAGDFDIAYASMDGLAASNELDGWEFEQTTDFRGSYASNATMEYTHISQPSKGMVGDSQWGTCKGLVRNLWVTITRVKDSDPQPTMAQNSRQLQFYPNGTKFADFDITFTNSRGSNASLLKVVSVAFAAGLAALAF